MEGWVWEHWTIWSQGLEKQKSPHSYHQFPFKSDSRKLKFNKNKKELNHIENRPMKVGQDYLDASRF